MYVCIGGSSTYVSEPQRLIIRIVFNNAVKFLFPANHFKCYLALKKLDFTILLDCVYDCLRYSAFLSFSAAISKIVFCHVFVTFMSKI